jgi:hypothetical protein
MARKEAAPRRGAFQGGDRRTLLAGNWKMNMTHLEAIGLVQKLAFTIPDPVLDTAEVVVLPPFTALRSVQTLVTGDKLAVGFGAQDISAHDSGAYTGEVSGGMLAALACQYVTVGHSERRMMHAEDDAVVSAKAQAALRHGVVPIVCVGEGLDVRRAGEHVGFCTDRHRRGGHPGGRTGGVRRAPGAARRAVRPGDGRIRPYPLRRVGEGREHGRDPGRAGHRRCPRRRRQPGRRRVRADLSDRRRRQLSPAAAAGRM